MREEGDTACAERLLKPAKNVLIEGLSIKHESFDRRVKLWTEILENRDKYKDDECGPIKPEFDELFRARFDAALLVLAASFTENGDSFEQARLFNAKEISAYKNIERYNYFELYKVDDIKRKLLSRDDKILGMLEEYYIHMGKWIDSTLEDPELRLTIRYFLKRKWDGYKLKLNEAVNAANQEADWLVKLVGMWQTKKNYETGQYQQVIDELTRKTETQKKEIGQLNDKVKEGEETITVQSATINAQQTLITDLETIIKERKRLPKPDGGPSRLTSTEEATMYENTFIGRMQTKFTDTISFLSTTYKVSDVSMTGTEDLKRYVGAGMPPLTEHEAKKFPVNRLFSARLTEKKLLGKKETIRVEARYIAHIKEYVQNGYDTAPLSLEDLNVYFRDAWETASMQKEKNLLCIASPTGFAKKIQNHINSDTFHRNYTSRYLSVCLLDIELGTVLFNPHDEYARAFSSMCELVTETEKYQRVRREMESFIEEQILLRSFATFRDVLALHTDDLLVKRAFYDIAEEKGRRVEFIEEAKGLVMIEG